MIVVKNLPVLHQSGVSIFIFLGLIKFDSDMGPFSPILGSWEIECCLSRCLGAMQTSMLPYDKSQRNTLNFVLL